MRLTRGTVIMIVVLLVLIIAAVALINRTEAPGEEELTGENTTAVAGGPILPGVDQGSVTRWVVRDNFTGHQTVMTKQGQAWGLSGGDGIGREWELTGVVEPEAPEPFSISAPEGMVLDDVMVVGTLGVFADLEATDSFPLGDADINSFGLSQPRYTMYLVTTDGAVHVMHVGGKNPDGTRYYVTTQQIGDANITFEATELAAELDRSDVETSIDPLPAGEGVAEGEGTQEAGIFEQGEFEATDDASALAEATLDPTLSALATQMQSESTEEAEVAAATYSAIIQATNAAAGEGTAEATAEATEGGAQSGEAGEDFGAVMVTSEAGAAAEATPMLEPEATEPPRQPLVNLTTVETIYLVPVDLIDNLARLITQPPVMAAPTPEGGALEDTDNVFMTEEAIGSTGEPPAEPTPEPPPGTEVDVEETDAPLEAEETDEPDAEATAEATQGS